VRFLRNIFRVAKAIFNAVRNEANELVGFICAATKSSTLIVPTDVMFKELGVTWEK
jgi:hypothetical protein